MQGSWRMAHRHSDTFWAWVRGQEGFEHNNICVLMVYDIYTIKVDFEIFVKFLFFSQVFF